MGIPVLILGESGSGKSTSMRNFDPSELTVFNVANKLLPFRKKLNVINNAGYGTIGKELQKQEKKIYVIDDSQYLLAFELFNRAKEKGYDKFTDIAVRFEKMLDYIIKGTLEDCIVYLLHHCETTDTGKVKAKTVGKMLDNQLTVEGLFSIVLYAFVEDDKHLFMTKNDGFCPAKAPMGMFEPIIDNDLKFVDTTIREYYNL
ncbi:MAG TPA: ATP-binding protein [Ruminococcaceae bacterium]|nr:ATP-binding protein [Oscillospiraceae bacterium]